MADITEESLKRTTEALKVQSAQILESKTNIDTMTESSNALSTALIYIQNSGSSVGDILGSVTNLVDKLKESLSKTTESTLALSLGFSAAALGAVGARESFKNFDSSSLNTYTKQLQSTIQAFKSGQLGISAFSSIMKKIGFKLPPMNSDELIGDYTSRLGKYAEQLLISADNQTRLQNGMIQLAAHTGSLDNLYSRIGVNMKNFNDIAHEQGIMIAQTASATKFDTVTAEDYYTKLGKIPESLESMVESSDKAIGHSNMLAATMLFVRGSGRDQAEVMDDLAKAYTNMGLAGEGALKFTARIGEISNKFGVELNIVRDSINNATSLIRNFGGENLKNGNIMEGVVKIMNNYVGALKETGISGATAIGVTQDMTNRIIGLDVAQRSFLSQQSGGPGGLRGAFKVERMIREGDIDQVIKDAEKVMKKQFGKIVSTKEAEQNEGAASTAIMQRMMLTEGPLGAFVKSEQDAARVLEMLSKKDRGEITQTELKDNILQENMDKGTKLQELTNTAISVTNNKLEELRSTISYSAQSIIQQLAGGRVGTQQFANEEGIYSPESVIMRDNMREQARKSQEHANESTQNIGRAIHGSTETKAPKIISEAVNDRITELPEIADTITSSIISSAEQMKRLVQGKGVSVKTQIEELYQDIELTNNSLKEEKNNNDTFKVEKLNRLLNKQKEELSDQEDYQKESGKYIGTPSYETSSFSFDPKIDKNDNKQQQQQTAAELLGSTVETTTNARVGEQKKEKQKEASTTEVAANNESKPIDINLNIDTTCANCGAHMRTTAQQRIRGNSSTP